MGNVKERGLLAACGLMLSAALLWHSLVPLTSDVSFFVVATGRMLDGARLYADIFDINPPLIYWMTVPPVWAARSLELTAHHFFVFWVCGLVAASLYMVQTACASAGQPRAETKVLVLTSSALLTLFPAESFGQREHFAAFLLLPYLAAAHQAASGRRGALRVLVICGAAAGIGVVLKPYFLAIPVIVEILLLASRRDWRLLFRPETLSMSVPVLIYPAVIWALTPEYFTVVLPVARMTYSVLEHPAAVLLADLAINKPVVAALAAAIVSAWWTRAWNPGGMIWSAAAVGGLISYMIQAKGWNYHALPIMIFALIGISLALARSKAALRAAGGGALGAMIVSSQLQFAAMQRALLAQGDALVDGHAPSSMMLFGDNHGVLFPFIEVRGIQLVGRLPSLWMLLPLDKNMLTADQASKVVEFVTPAVAADLSHWQPNYVIVDRRAITYGTRGGDLNYVARLSQSPEFAAAWSSYELVRTRNGVELWKRRD